MSFGGTVPRGRRGPGSSGPRSEVPRRPGTAGVDRPVGADDEGGGEIDWERVALFGTGIAIGAALGAGVALLFAPASGEEVRAAIARRSARLANHGRGAWDDLRDELRWAARRGKRRVGRRVRRARWAAEDFLDDRRPTWWRATRRPEPKELKRRAAEIDDRAVEEIVEALS